MGVNKSTASDGNQQTFASLTTDLCLYLAEAGLTLRDIQSCLLVSHAWHQAWDAAIRQSPHFFLKLFFPVKSKYGSSASSSEESSDESSHTGPSSSIDSARALKRALKRNTLGLDAEEIREARRRLFQRRMRESLACWLEDACELAIIPLGMSQDGTLPQPGQGVSFQEKKVLSSVLHEPFDESSPTDLFYRDGLVAWELDEHYFVVDNLRERTWQVLPITKHGERGWTYDRPRIDCLSNDILVTVSSGARRDVPGQRDGHREVFAELIVYNLHTETQIKFEHAEFLRLHDKYATFHAVGHDIVTLCSYSRRVVRYRMRWEHGPFLNAGNGESLKVDEIQLPHPNISHIFFDGGGKTDTIFAVSHGKKEVAVYEYLHTSLHTQHRASSKLPEDLLQEDAVVDKVLYRKADSRGTIELFTTSQYHTDSGFFARSSFFFFIPTRNFYWRDYSAYPDEVGLLWDGWAYSIDRRVQGGRADSHPRHWLRVGVGADQCTAPTEGTRRRRRSVEGLSRKQYDLTLKVPTTNEPDTGSWWEMLFVDDEFIVFKADQGRGSYCALSRKYADGEEEVMLHRGGAPSEVESQ